MKKLGKAQQGVLACLRQHGAYHSHGFGSGWVWNNRSGTERVLDALVKRGLVEKDEHGVYRLKKGVATNA